MPSTTTNFSLYKPLVNDPVDEDLWGGYLNSNTDIYDQRLVPTGTITMYAGTTAPNSSWLLCDGTGKSRSTYSALFAVISTTFGSSDTLTFKVPDLRGRVGIGLDNLGGSSANRITDSNADTLGGSGGSETRTPAGTVGTSGATTLATADIPAHTHTFNNDQGGAGSAQFVSSAAGSATAVTSSSTGGGGSHTHTGGTFSGTSMNVTQPWLALGAIIKT